ncbi:MAG: hypothetical protein LBI82_07175, partial [Dysgonamonadaceae bacterium]|nr:hypothetical protein [Dysgonamonadaceae bacterium]
MKRLSILIAAFFICISISAQEQTSGFDRSKLFFGGSLGLSLSSNYTIVKIAPQVGYQFNPYFAAGGGVGYNYFGYSDHFSSWSLNYLGLNVFGRATPTKYVALQIQPEIYRMWGSHLSESRVVPCVLVGGGIILPTG